MIYKDMTETYVCDDCKKSFPGKEIKLQPAATNVDIIGQSIYIVDKDDKIQKGPTSQLKEGDQTIHCPHCGALHLFGFDKMKD